MVCSCTTRHELCPPAPSRVNCSCLVPCMLLTVSHAIIKNHSYLQLSLLPVCRTRYATCQTNFLYLMTSTKWCHLELLSLVVNHFRKIAGMKSAPATSMNRQGHQPLTAADSLSNPSEDLCISTASEVWTRTRPDENPPELHHTSSTYSTNYVKIYVYVFFNKPTSSPCSA